MSSRRVNTIVWAIIACLLWSTAYPFIKIGLEYSTPLHFAGSRFILSGLMILPFTVRPKLYIRMIRENLRLVVWVTLLQTVINYVLFYLGMDLVPGAIGAVIVGAQPFVTAIVSRIMIKEERFTRAKVLTIILGLAGICTRESWQAGISYRRQTGTCRDSHDLHCKHFHSYKQRTHIQGRKENEPACAELILNLYGWPFYLRTIIFCRRCAIETRLSRSGTGWFLSGSHSCQPSHSPNGTSSFRDPR